MSNYPDNYRGDGRSDVLAHHRIERLLDEDAEGLKLFEDLLHTIEEEAAAYRKHMMKSRKHMNQLFMSSIRHRLIIMGAIAEDLHATGKFQEIIKEYVEAWGVEDMDIMDVPEVQFGTEDFHKLRMKHIEGDFNIEYCE